MLDSCLLEPAGACVLRAGHRVCICQYMAQEHAQNVGILHVLVSSVLVLIAAPCVHSETVPRDKEALLAFKDGLQTDQVRPPVSPRLSEPFCTDAYLLDVLKGATLPR